MAYNIKTIYPKEEQMNSNENTFTTTRKQELAGDKTYDEVLNAYEDYQRQGYNVTTTITLPEEADETVSPFEIAERLTTSGIDYKATLKIKNSGTYETAITLARTIERYAYDFVVDIKMKINEDSPVNIDHESSWMDPDYVVYKVTPKASATDINELKGLYEAIEDLGYEPTIDIKPKKKSGSEDDFATQLSAYPEGAEITFTLKDSEY